MGANNGTAERKKSSMKFNLIYKMDTDKLDSNILVVQPKYIVMNLETANNLSAQTSDVLTLEKDKKKWNDGCVSLYRGIPIAYCEELEYGEVDLVK